MGRRSFHLRPAAVLLGIGAAAVLVASARAEPSPTPELRATMTCDRVAEPGRVRCSVEARVPDTRVLGWADVVVLELPELATPLKARVGAESVTARQPGTVSWAFALVARRAGRGEARARVRAVSCERVADGGASAERCVPVSVEVRAELVVGS